MKTSTKILIMIFIISSIGLAFTSAYIFSALSLAPSGIKITMTTPAWIGIILTIINTISGNILYMRFLKSRKFNSMLFFSTVPTTLGFGAVVYVLATINTNTTNVVQVVKTALKINEANNNNLYWIILVVLVYLAVIFVVFSIVTRPVRKIEKACSKLSFGEVKNQIVIGGNKDFKEIEYSLNKINDNYKQKEVYIQQTNSEFDKFIPKQIVKMFGKKNATQLEIGAKVQKEVTTLYCDIRNSQAVSSTLSMEENFNYINSYLNLVSPLIRKHNGFVDKYLGDGVLAVFTSPDQAINCAHAIYKTILQKNIQNKSMPNLDVGISISTQEVVFGVVGDEVRKAPAIISNAMDVLTKMQDIIKKFGCVIVFSKNTLNSISGKTDISYRYIGNIQIEDDNQLISLFESLSVYAKNKRDKLEKYKTEFEEGVRKYNNAKFAQAQTIFENVYRQEKDDKVCYVYYNKCAEKQISPKISTKKI